MNSSDSSRQFAVIGNPVKHSRSPVIHEQFGLQTGVALHYGLLESPLDAFAQTVNDFFARGGRGLNVTVPFKEQAYALCQARLSDRARLAGAVNTMWLQDNQLHGCNTDGVGLLTDIERLGVAVTGKRILLVGAGGAAKGALFPLLTAGCAAVRVVNRTAQRALDLKQYVNRHLPDQADKVSAGGLDQAHGDWDIVINATSSSLSDQAPDLPGARYAPDALAYDMMYGAQPTAFMVYAQAQGASHIADGLGMLVGQAAESFLIWNGVKPDPEPVLAMLRARLTGR